MGAHLLGSTIFKLIFLKQLPAPINTDTEDQEHTLSVFYSLNLQI